MQRNGSQNPDKRKPTSASRRILLAFACVVLALGGLWASIAAFAGPRSSTIDNGEAQLPLEAGTADAIPMSNGVLPYSAGPGEVSTLREEDTATMDASPSSELPGSLLLVTGFVLDERRQPVAGATVQIGPSLRTTERVLGSILDKLREAHEANIEVLRRQLDSQLAQLEGARTSTLTNNKGQFSMLVSRVSRVGYRIAVEHKGMSPLELDPVRLSEMMTLIMLDWGSLSGQVLDEHNKPIEDFSIAVSELYGGKAAWTRRVSRHVNGRFRLGQLERGSYFLFINPLGHARIHLGPFDIVPGYKHPPITVRVRRGVAATGRVIDARMGKPIARAVIQVLLPPDPLNPLADARLGEQVQVIARSVSAADGSFRLPHLSPGHYWLRVKARSFSRLIKKDFILVRNQEEFVLLQMLGTADLYGWVSGLDPTRSAWVIISSSKGVHRSVRVNPKSGRYTAFRLDVGAYFVELRLGSPGSGRVARLALLHDFPDLYLKGDEAVRFDFTAPAKQVDRVYGNITLNGEPSDKLSVRLRKPLTARQARRRFSQLVQSGARLWFRIPSTRSRSTETNDSGNFTFDRVPAGEYWLEVAERSRKLRGYTILHRELVRVRGKGLTNLSLSLETGPLSYSIEGGLKPGRNSMLLYLVLEDEARGNKKPRSWLSLPSFQAVRIQESKGVVRRLPVGEYRYALHTNRSRPSSGLLRVRRRNSRRQAEITLRTR